MTDTQPFKPEPRLAQAYADIQSRVAAAAQRNSRQARDVVVVAVTKTATVAQIAQLARLGHRDIGENRVQQLVQRTQQVHDLLADQTTPEGEPLAQRLRWHMIGHLQRNKIKTVVPVVRLIHSLDTLRLADDLHAYGRLTDRVIDVLVEVNISGESTKHGVATPAVVALCEQIDTMIHLRLRGLMTMAPWSENPEDSRPIFSRCFELMQELRQRGVGGDQCNILSMGMSNDFEVAIEEGANLVRIGRALFGEREVV